MNITELIVHLDKVRETSGDLEVEIPDGGCGCCGYSTDDITDIHLVSYGDIPPRLHLTDRQLDDHRHGKQAKVTSVLTGADADPREWEL
ncbi:hypothetical protein ACWZHB_01120 [Nocardia sp. FBN12]|uniref:hypothetical protein n=1 Tax=Nocardia sp. FBN12 TaxID=3419766 RepID=UPI003D00AD1E